MRKIILASGSPRRKDILEFLGVPFEAVVSDFPEEAVLFEDFDSTIDYVSTIAVGKVLTVAPEYSDALILGADTTVVLDGKVYNKPQNLDEARSILRTLRGRRHIVTTGVVLLDTLTQQKDIIAVESSVEFLPLSDEQIENYVATGEPLGKAGAYAIQMGAKPFVKSIEGSISNIVGLPIEETAALFEQFDVPIDVDIKTLVREHFSFDE